jgi:hypothetical protein
VEELRRLLPTLKLRKAHLRLPCPERAPDPVQKAVFRCYKAWDLLKAPCFIEECELNLEKEEGQVAPFPGLYYRQVRDQRLGSIHVHGVLSRLIKGRVARGLARECLLIP